ncbi:heterokaryon incompatibility protein-domain-containing protein [Hypoxylon argillaceum]|nr:heterokaryon incompatibility protein-domain-containing protein [Hypoxylon argillaceum]
MNTTVDMKNTTSIVSQDRSCAICNKFQGKWKVASYAENRCLPGTRHHVVPNLAWDEILASSKSCYCCKILVSGCLGCLRQHGIYESDVLHEDADKILIFLLKNERRFEVELFATEDDGCPVPESWDYIPTSGRTSRRTDSNAALVIIKGWISSCIVNHCTLGGLCDSPTAPALPTRIVDVGLVDGIVKLVETKGTRSKYVSLSHCWGHSHIITTTKSTLEQRKSGIAWHDLSQTFRDAILVTRALGVPYIWIDSLCIVQDDKIDWATESANMASIYSNGYLTIAATFSANGHGGLFSQTGDFEVSGKTRDGEDYRLFFRERIDHHIDVINDMAMFSKDGGIFTMGGYPTSTYHPLLTRAWVYQERMLSTRVLHFGRYEVFFECRATIQCECGGIEFHGSLVVPRVLVKIEYSYAFRDQDRGDEEQYQVARLWRTIICAYTTLLLTKSEDRLPAIGGLARDMATSRKSRYLAGLWEETLNDDLLWVVSATSKHKKPRPYPRNAPTWSWASVETWVLYWDETLFTTIEDADLEERLPYEHYGKIETCGVDWSPTAAVDEFGSIARGLLTISGLVARGVLEREVGQKSGEEEEHAIYHYVAFPRVRLPIDADYLLDHDGPDQTKPGTEVFCLRMSRVQEGSTDHLLSLVLRKSPEGCDLFERIGMLVVPAKPPPVDSIGEVFEGAGFLTVSII